jgi:hypothetical protein
MYRLYALSLLALIAAGPAPRSIEPDDHLTPGAILTTDAHKVCARGYARTVRHTSAAVKRAVYRAYGIDPSGGAYTMDHRFPLELGGADVASNLMPQLDADARRKDKLENRLHAMVCAGQMQLTDAQAAFAGDWRISYQRFLGGR